MQSNFEWEFTIHYLDEYIRCIREFWRDNFPTAWIDRNQIFAIEFWAKVYDTPSRRIREFWRGEYQVTLIFLAHELIEICRNNEKKRIMEKSIENLNFLGIFAIEFWVKVYDTQLDEFVNFEETN